MKSVSVIVPIFNRAESILNIANSVLIQNVDKIELIIVDDFSKDYHIVLEKLRKIRDLDINIIRLPKKGNGSIARNVGIENARYEFIAFLDSDDRWKNNHLKDCLKFINDHNCDGVYTNIIVDNGLKHKEIKSRVKNFNESTINFLLSDGMAQTSSIVIKKDSLSNIRFDEFLRRHQDYDFFIKLDNKLNIRYLDKSNVIVSWDKDAFQRTIHEDCIKFIKKFRGEISTKIYQRYIVKQYLFCLLQGNDIESLNYYKKELSNFISILPLICRFMPSIILIFLLKSYRAIKYG